MQKCFIWAFCLTLTIAIVLGSALNGWASDLHLQSEAIGKQLHGVWAVPFVCMLLSIAVGPLAFPLFWHHHYGKVSLFWGLAFLVPFTVIHGFQLALYVTLHTILLEYIPFIALLFALFTITGGICLKGSLTGTPKVNAGILLAGTLLASLLGTTGAAMALIRPLMRAVSYRKYKTHTIIFFIFLVANIGGCLTPLGDPPIFIGFLKGVSFFWPTKHLFLPFALTSAILLLLYLCLDTILYNKEGRPAAPHSGPAEKLGLEGGHNLMLVLGVMGAVLISGMWKPGIYFTIYHVDVGLQEAVRDLLLVCLAAVSLKTTRLDTRRRNEFNWEPLAEVAKLFYGIFLSMIPAIAILKAGQEGALRNLIAMVFTDGSPNNAMFFALTGFLSGFLDNAPTYLVFFNVAGGNADVLMTTLSKTLLAISMGAVFMGANTYIGNAPNFMVRSIAESGGIRMPGFFGYMVWSAGILIPCSILVAWIFL